MSMHLYTKPKYISKCDLLPGARIRVLPLTATLEYTRLPQPYLCLPTHPPPLELSNLSVMADSEPFLYLCNLLMRGR